MRKNIPNTPLENFISNFEELPFPPTLHPIIELALTVDVERRIDLVYVVPYQRDVGLDVGGTYIAGSRRQGSTPTCHDI